MGKLSDQDLIAVWQSKAGYSTLERIRAVADAVEKAASEDAAEELKMMRSSVAMLRASGADEAPRVSGQHLRLHMGELSSTELRSAQAAYRLALTDAGRIFNEGGAKLPPPAR